MGCYPCEDDRGEGRQDKMADTQGRAGSGGRRRKNKPPRTPLLHRARNYFLTGLVVAAPVGITVYLTWSFVSFVDNHVKPLVPAAYNPESYLPFSVPGLGLIFSILFLIVLGWFTAKTFGRTLVTWGENLVDRMPIVRSIYNGLKQIIETVLSQQSASFQKVAMIEYPRKGLWALVFVTSEAKGEVANATRQDLVAVFLPTTPNPTSGFLLYVPKEDLHVLDMTVEQAAKLIISGGMVVPPAPGTPAAAAAAAKARRKPVPAA